MINRYKHELMMIGVVALIVLSETIVNFFFPVVTL